MAEIWFSSDLHLFHENIIKFCGRPFKDAKEMSFAIREKHNELVKPQDHWYNLGDVTLNRGGVKEQNEFIQFIQRFHGHKRLLLGNHDHFGIKTYIAAGFEKIYATWRGIDNILLSHIPVHPGSMGSAVANVHGHIHDHVSPEPVIWRGYPERPLVTPTIQPYINVCVEWTDYKPITLGELKSRISLKIRTFREEMEAKLDGNIQTDTTG